MDSRRLVNVTAGDNRIAEMAERVNDLMCYMGIDPNASPSTIETPRRVAKFLLEYHNPIKDPKDVLGPLFDANGHNSLVVQQNLPFRMGCEHHLLPALGRAHIGYLPRRHLIGLSKFARLVDAVGTERPSLQEAIGDRIAKILDEYADTSGVAVIIKAEHTCMACRGVNVPGVPTTTSSLLGNFVRVDALRAEFFQLLKL